MLVQSMLYLARLVLGGKGRCCGALGVGCLGHPGSLRSRSWTLTCATTVCRTVTAMSEAHNSRPATGPAISTDRPTPAGAVGHADHDQSRNPEPLDITPEPRTAQAGSGDNGHAGTSVPSRRRLIALGSALAVALAGTAVLGTFGWRVTQQSDAVLDTPTEVAGLVRDDSESAITTADYLRTGLNADVELDHTIGAVYADPKNPRRSVLLTGGTTLVLQPDSDLDTVFGLVSDSEGTVTGLREVPAGKLGGVMKCGTTTSNQADQHDMAVCGWADHGSIALAMFPDRTVDESAALLRQIREVIQVRR